MTAMTVTRCDGRNITGVRYPPIYTRGGGDRLMVLATHKDVICTEDATPLLIFLAKISGTRYHEPSAQDARRRIAAFFGRHLKE